MTKKDYEALAGAFRDAHAQDVIAIDRPTLTAIAQLIAAKLQADNSRFDASRFYAACGL